MSVMVDTFNVLLFSYTTYPKGDMRNLNISIWMNTHHNY